MTVRLALPVPLLPSGKNTENLLLLVFLERQKLEMLMSDDMRMIISFMPFSNSQSKKKKRTGPPDKKWKNKNFKISCRILQECVYYSGFSETHKNFLKTLSWLTLLVLWYLSPQVRSLSRLTWDVGVREYRRGGNQGIWRRGRALRENSFGNAEQKATFPSNLRSWMYFGYKGLPCILWNTGE